MSGRGPLTGWGHHKGFFELLLQMMTSSGSERLITYTYRGQKHIFLPIERMSRKWRFWGAIC